MPERNAEMGLRTQIYLPVSAPCILPWLHSAFYILQPPSPIQSPSKASRHYHKHEFTSSRDLAAGYL